MGLIIIDFILNIYFFYFNLLKLQNFIILLFKKDTQKIKMEKIIELNNQISRNNTSISKGVWVTKLANLFDFKQAGNLKGKTVLITGASRGIGLSIGKRCAKDGANVVILAKTVSPHPNLPGTIYTAAQEINNLGGKGLPLICDIRFEE